jgi:hypothetical protein
VTGRVEVRPNCTGTTNLAQTIQGMEAPPLTLTFFILEAGKQMKAMAISPGATLSCTKDRLSLNTN